MLKASFASVSEISHYKSESKFHFCIRNYRKQKHAVSKQRHLVGEPPQSRR